MPRLLITVAWLVALMWPHAARSNAMDDTELMEGPKGQARDDAAKPTTPEKSHPKGGQLYVGNLSFAVGDEDLRKLFEKAGPVQSVVIIRDSETKQSRGFGFVEMMSPAGAEKAIEMFDGFALQGRSIRINEARQLEGPARTNRARSQHKSR